MVDVVRGTVYAMSSDSDHPRQRTVAELLAAHGAGTATGRRARRRAAEDAGQSEPGAGPAAAGPLPLSPASAGSPSVSAYFSPSPAVPGRNGAAPVDGGTT